MSDHSDDHNTYPRIERRKNPHPAPVAEPPKDPRIVDGEVELLKARIQKERAATWQSLAMAALTGLSAVAVGFTLIQGRKGPTPASSNLVKPQ